MDQPLVDDSNRIWHNLQTDEALRRFIAQFHNGLIYVLLIASAVTALLAEWANTGVILGVVIVNSLRRRQ